MSIDRAKDLGIEINNLFKYICSCNSDYYTKEIETLRVNLRLAMYSIIDSSYISIEEKVIV